MGHLKYDKKTRAESTPAEWLGVGAAVGQLANKWADRYDLVGYVGPGAGGVAPACYTPATAEIEVNVEVAFTCYSVRVAKSYRRNLSRSASRSLL